MKHIYYIIIIGIMMQSCSVSRRMERKGDIVITPSKLELRANQNSDPTSVEVQYSLIIPKGYISRSAQFVAIPHFRGSGNILPLTSIYISGRKYERLEKRRILFGEIPEAKAAFTEMIGSHAELGRIEIGEAMLYEGAVKIVGKRKEIIINMRDVVPYEPWMESAELVMPTMVAACRNVTLMNSHTLAHGVAYAPKQELPVRVEISKPKPPMVKNEKWESQINFEINSYKVILTFSDNEQKVDSLNMILKRLSSEKGVTLTKVNIVGYSSPDGPLELNQKLAKERAMTLKNHIITNLSIDPRIIKTSTDPADWAMLRELVMKSDMSGKANVLQVIDENANNDIRNALLRKMPEYTYIKNRLFPQIRKAVVEISYRKIVN